MAKTVYGNPVDLEAAKKYLGSGYKYVDTSKSGSPSSYRSGDIVVGGKDAVGGVSGTASGATRLAGSDRYGTEGEIARYAESLSSGSSSRSSSRSSRPSSKPRYQEPMDFQKLFEQVKEMQTPAIEKDMKTLMGDLATRGEQRGLWTSGIQSELERQAAEDLQKYYANNAMQQAMQMAGLSLQEQQQLFDQFHADRTFDRGLLESDRAFGLNQFQTYAPYQYLTEHQRQRLPYDWTQLMGATPSNMQNVKEYAGERAVIHATKKNNYDIVNINGYEIDVDAVGGRVENGEVYLPQYIIDQVLSLPGRS